MRPLHKIYCLILLGFWQSGRLLIAYIVSAMERLVNGKTNAPGKKTAAMAAANDFI